MEEMVEKLCGRRKYYYPNIESKKEAAVPIYKLHGSINWMEKREPAKTSNRNKDLTGGKNPKIYFTIEEHFSKALKINAKSKIYYRLFKDKKAGKDMYTPVFIPFFAQKEQWFNERWWCVFEPLWECIKNELSKIEEIYFIGYRFPTVDYYMSNFLLMVFSKKHPKISIIVKNDESCNLIKILRRFKPKICNSGLEKFLRCKSI